MMQYTTFTGLLLYTTAGQATNSAVRNVGVIDQFKMC